MRQVVIGVLYVVIGASLAFAATMAYSLYELWELKLQIGTVRITALSIAGAIVLGAGLPYCMIHYLRKK